MEFSQPPDTASLAGANDHWSAAHLPCRDKDLVQEVGELLVDRRDTGDKIRYIWIIQHPHLAVQALHHTPMSVSLDSTTMIFIRDSGAAL